MIDDILDEIFEGIDACGENGEITSIDALLLLYNPTIMIGILTATLPTKSQLKNRQLLVDVAQAMKLPIEGLE